MATITRTLTGRGKNQALAREILRERGSFVRPGVLEARRISLLILAKVLAAFRKGHNIVEVASRELERLVPILAVGMSVAYLTGRRRVILNAPTALQLSYNKAITFLEKRLSLTKIEVELVAESYGATSFQVMKEATAKLEKDLQKVMIEITRENLHVKDGIVKLRKTFNKNGLGLTESWRLETVYRTQTQLAYAAGQRAQELDPDIQEILWGYKYVTVGDNRVRETHAPLDGLMLPKEDPFWADNLPPNGWNCRCMAIQLFDPPSGKLRRPPTQIPADVGFRFDPINLLDPLENAGLRDRILRKIAGNGGTNIFGKYRGKEWWQGRLVRLDEFIAKKKTGKIIKTLAQIVDPAKLVPSVRPSAVVKIVKKKPKKVSLGVLQEDLRRLLQVEEVSFKGFAADGRLSGEVIDALTREVRRLNEVFGLKNVSKRLDQMIVEAGEYLLQRKGALGNWRVSGSVFGEKGLIGRLTIARGNRKLLSSGTPKVGQGSWSVGQSFQDTFRHELGHAVYWELSARNQREVFKVWNSLTKKGIKADISSYAATNFEEFFAESFSAYTHKGYGLGKRLPRQIEEILESILGKHPNLILKPGVKKTVKKVAVKRLSEKDLRKSMTVTELGAFEEWVKPNVSKGIREVQIKGISNRGAEQVLQKLNDVYARAPLYNGTTFRGLHSLDVKDAKRFATLGNTVEFDAWTSTSINRQVANIFSRDVPRVLKTQKGDWIRFEIRTTNGLNASILTDTAKSLQEVIIPKGTKYRVVQTKRVEAVGRIEAGWEVVLEEMAGPNITTIIRPPTVVKVIPKAVIKPPAKVTLTAAEKLEKFKEGKRRAAKKFADKKKRLKLEAAVDAAKEAAEKAGKEAAVKPSIKRLKNVEEWEKSLTIVEKSAINDYTAWGYRDVRAFQSGAKIGAVDLKNGERIAKFLNDMYAKAPLYDGRLYRGLNELSKEMAKKFATKGLTIELEAWTSMSKSKKIGQSFSRAAEASPGNFWVEISIKSSKKGMDLGKQGILRGAQKEVLLPKGTKFRVISSREEVFNGRRGFVVELEEIAGPNIKVVKLPPVVKPSTVVKIIPKTVIKPTAKVTLTAAEKLEKFKEGKKRAAKKFAEKKKRLKVEAKRFKEKVISEHFFKEPSIAEKLEKFKEGKRRAAKKFVEKKKRLKVEAAVDAAKETPQITKVSVKRFDNLETWEKSLSEKERKAIAHYTLGVPEDLVMSEGLVSAYRKVPLHKGELYRGLHDLSGEAAEKFSKLGNTVRFDEWTSTTTKRSVAREFGRDFPPEVLKEGKWIEYRIEKSTNGMNLGSRSAYEGPQFEVMIPKGSEYKIIKKTELIKNGRTGFIVELEEIAGPNIKVVKPSPVVKTIPKIEKERLKVEAWRESLTTGERESLRVWTSISWESIQEAQKGLTYSKVILEQLDDIAKAYKKAPRYVGEAHRGMHELSPEVARTLSVVGSEIELDVWTSFTKNQKRAQNFGREITRKGEEWVEYRVKMRSGMDISGVTKSGKWAEELVVPKGARFKVTSAERVESTQGIITRRTGIGGELETVKGTVSPGWTIELEEISDRGAIAKFIKKPVSDSLLRKAKKVEEVQKVAAAKEAEAFRKKLEGYRKKRLEKKVVVKRTAATKPSPVVKPSAVVKTTYKTQKKGNETVKKWFSKLTEDEVESISDWVQGQSNEMKRVQLGKSTTRRATLALEDLRTAYQKTPLYQGEVGRGMSALRPDVAQKMAEVGGTIEMDTWQHFSSKKSIRKNFGREMAWGKHDKAADEWVEFRVRRSSNGMHLQEIWTDDEFEVLIPKGTKYKVVESQRVKEGARGFGWEIQLEEIAGPNIVTVVKPSPVIKITPKRFVGDDVAPVPQKKTAVDLWKKTVPQNEIEDLQIWKDKISNEAKNSLIAWGNNAARQTIPKIYDRFDYTKVREVYRGKRAVNEVAEKVIRGMTEAWEQAPSQVIKNATRAISELSRSDTQILTKVGNTFKMDSWTSFAPSTSAGDDIVKFVGRENAAFGSGKTWIEFKLPRVTNSMKINPVTLVKEFDEILVPPGTEYRIRKVTRVKKHHDRTLREGFQIVPEGFVVEIEEVSGPGIGASIRKLTRVPRGDPKVIAAERVKRITEEAAEKALGTPTIDRLPAKMQDEFLDFARQWNNSTGAKAEELLDFHVKFAVRRGKSNVNFAKFVNTILDSKIPAKPSTVVKVIPKAVIKPPAKVTLTAAEKLEKFKEGKRRAAKKFAEKKKRLKVEAAVDAAKEAATKAGKEVPVKVVVKTPEVKPSTAKTPEVKRKATVKDWEESLTQNELEAIDRYTQGFSLSEKPESFKHFNRAYEKSPLYEGVLYRGMNNVPKDAARKLSSKGSTIEFREWTSTTKSKSMAAEEFGRFESIHDADLRWIEYRIKKSTKGMDLGSTGAFKGAQSEVVLPRGSKYKVVESTPETFKGNAGFVVELEELAGPNVK